jgi:hypothetical protein
MTLEEWHAEGERLFGQDEMQWRFVCPACGHVATPLDWKNAGAKESHVAFSCVGRFMESPRDAFAKGPGPCNYAGGGLIGLNPVQIDGRKERYFAFAENSTA